jgi:hypothetical protein
VTTKPAVITAQQLLALARGHRRTLTESVSKVNEEASLETYGEMRACSADVRQSVADLAVRRELFTDQDRPAAAALLAECAANLEAAAEDFRKWADVLT